MPADLSAAGVGSQREQWKRQFSLCRDENDRSRNKVGSAETLTYRGVGRQHGTGQPGPSFHSFPTLLHFLPALVKGM